MACSFLGQSERGHSIASLLMDQLGHDLTIRFEDLQVRAYFGGSVRYISLSYLCFIYPTESVDNK